MTKKDIVDHVINNTTLSRSQAIEATESIVEAIRSSLEKGESVYIRGFATVKVVERKQKTARDIRKGTTVVVPARKAVKFIPSNKITIKH